MWSDKESDVDFLNFGEVSDLAIEILKSSRMLPVSLGIFGNWGAGKSSLLRLIENNLRSNGNEYLIVNFDAWLYQGYDDARASLLEAIATRLNEEAKNNSSLAKKTGSLLSRVNVFRLMGLASEGIALAHGIPTGGLLSKLVAMGGKINNTGEGQSQPTETDYQEGVQTLKDAAAAAKSIINPATDKTPPQEIDGFRKEYSEILKELGKPLIVFIDNLDRCLPINAIHTLEAIRLFLFLPNTAFIIAADEDMIRGAVSDYYSGISERHRTDYLDKLIQVPIQVPKAGIREIRAYLFMLLAIDHEVVGENLENLRSVLEESLKNSWRSEPISKEEALRAAGRSSDDNLASLFDLADRIAPTLSTSPLIMGNPRIVKRLLNVIKMRKIIASRRNMPLDESVIAKLVIFERCAGADATADLYHLIDESGGRPEIIKILEDNEGSELPKGCPDSWSKSGTSDFILNWSRLEPPLQGLDLKAAVYLSRETLPLGINMTGLTAQGREVLEAIIKMKNISSPNAKKAIENLPASERPLVMEGILRHLRQISDWNQRPPGFSGACLLAESCSESSTVLRRFINEFESKPLWMATMLKNQDWYQKGS